jgi:tetraacyldisaccharide 4'-kinase
VRWRELVDDPAPTVADRVALAGLTAASWIYRALLELDRTRHRLTGPWTPPVPSLTVGNVTVGGTGKTTLVRHLARRVLARGVRPGIILRGYGRTDPASTRLVHDGQRLLEGPESAGDEAVMLAEGLEGAVVVVGPSRRRSAELAIGEPGARALLFDDGLQHWALAAHRTVALWDATVDPRRARLLPRGVLREPVHELTRFDRVILTRWDAAENAAEVAAALAELRGGEPVPVARHEPVALLSDDGARRALAELEGVDVLAFSSLGNPGALRATLEALGARVVGERVFPDHHAYSRGDLDEIRAQARNLSTDRIVTTEKDYVKVRPLDPGGIEAIEVDFGSVAGAESVGPAMDDLVDFLCEGEVTAGGREEAQER